MKMVFFSCETKRIGKLLNHLEIYNQIKTLLKFIEKMTNSIEKINVIEHRAKYYTLDEALEKNIKMNNMKYEQKKNKIFSKIKQILNNIPVYKYIVLNILSEIINILSYKGKYLLEKIKLSTQRFLSKLKFVRNNSP